MSNQKKNIRVNLVFFVYFSRMGFYGEVSIRGTKNGKIEQISHFPISKHFTETWKMTSAYTEDEMFNPKRKFDYYYRFEYDFLLEQLKEMNNFENSFLTDNIKSIKAICETIHCSQMPTMSDLQYLQELIQDNLSARESFKREELEEVIQECKEAIRNNFTDVHIVYVGER
jgi:hypothetical protein